MKDYFLYTKCLITQQILKNRAVMRMHHTVMPKGKPSKLLYKKKNNTPIWCTCSYSHVLSCIKIIKKMLCFEIFIKLAFCFQGRMHVHIQVPVSIIIRHSWYMLHSSFRQSTGSKISWTVHHVHAAPLFMSSSFMVKYFILCFCKYEEFLSFCQSLNYINKIL